MTQSPTDLYRRWIDDVWNGSAEAVKQLVSDDFVGHWPDRDVNGPDALAQLIAQTHEMFSSLRFDIEVEPFSDGEFVAGRWIGRGRTAEGETRFIGNDILRARDGRFVEYWVGTTRTG